MPAFLNRLSGDKDLAGKVLDRFLLDTPQQIQSLITFVAAGSVTDAQDQAHRIKGSSANIGGNALCALAGEVEKAARDGDTAALKVHTVDLNRQFLQLKEEIAVHRRS